MKDDKLVKVLKRVLPVMSILTVFVFVMLINKKSYALFHKRIETDITIHITTADEMPFKLGTDVVKDTIGQAGGVIGVKADNTSTTNADDEVREYRYSGNDEIKNYIYFNCESGATEEDASSKCELWRIIGIFKDESGSEHLKIVRDNVLTADMFPENYTIEGTTYNIKYTSGNYAYWNSSTPETYKNDWATAGLQYWLNTEEDETEGEANKGYLSYLKGA